MSSSAPNPKGSESRNSSPTALIAGGAGFLGSHLVQTLISQNFKVVCVDNFSTGKKENLKEVLTSPNFSLIEGDINSPNFSLPPDLKIDYCFHLASVEDYVNKGLSLDTLLVNSLGTKQLLEIAREQSAKFILVSAADLYSGAISSSSLRYYFGKTPTEEAVLSAHEAKRFSEALAFEYYKKYKLPLTIIRVKDVYGPRMELSRGDDISRILRQALDKDTLEIPGDGLTLVNPTFVSDVIFGLIKAAVGDFSGEIFILVNPDKITVESFAQTVKLVAGPLEVEHVKDSDSLEFRNQHFDLENTKEKLSWKPKVTLAEGISSVLHQVQMKQSQEKTPEVETKAKEESTPEPAKKPRRKAKVWLRAGVFVLAASLLVITLLYPIGSFSLNSYLGKSRLTESYQQLLAENNDESLTQALKAQQDFQEGADSLNNLSWIIKIVGLSKSSSSVSETLDAAALLSEAIRATARANQILLSSSDQAGLTPDQAKDRLNQVLDNLYAAQDTLVEAQIGLDQVTDKKTLLILPSHSYLSSTNVSLQKQVDDLIVTIEAALAKVSTED